MWIRYRLRVVDARGYISEDISEGKTDDDCGTRARVWVGGITAEQGV